MRGKKFLHTATALLMKWVYNMRSAVSRETIAVNALALATCRPNYYFFFFCSFVAMFYGWKNIVICVGIEISNYNLIWNKKKMLFISEWNAFEGKIHPENASQKCKLWSMEIFLSQTALKDSIIWCVKCVLQLK